MSGRTRTTPTEGLHPCLVEQPGMETYRITADGSVYYLTFTVIDWLPLFVREVPCMIMADSLNYCIHNKGLLVHAYVIMPTHMHAVLADRHMDASRLARTLTDFRKFTGHALANWCDTEGAVAFRRAIRENATGDRDRRLWQPSRHPEMIFSNAFLETKVNYLHDNPVRAGLVRLPEHWRFSSASFYASGGVETCDVELACLEW